jgi:hypothetical protein
MTWAAERRLVVYLIVGAFLAVLAAIVFLAVFYDAPSCTDGVKNHGEEGIDCGGSCKYLCTMSVEPATVLFTQALDNGEGRLDVVALIENKNREAAAQDIPYTVTVYGYDQSLLQSVTGTFDLPPGATVPVFLPGIAAGQAAVGNAFLTIDPEKVQWYAQPRDPRIVPRVSHTALGGTASAPRVSATLSNPDVRPLSDVKVIVMIKDARGNAIAASQTIVPSIPAHGQSVARFAWNRGFIDTPVSIQVMPVIPLP